MSLVFNIIFLIFSLVWFTVFTYVFVSCLFKMLLPFLFGGAPYVASGDQQISTMISLTDIKPGEKVLDLGAGDGRIVIALAKNGIESHGYEINPVLVWRGQKKIKALGLQNKAFMHAGNFWNKNLSGFDVIIIYGISFAMAGLERKLKKELKPGARVVCNYFHFPTWRPLKKEGTVYLYQQTL